MQKKKKIIRATTVPTSLETFCEKVLSELNERYEVVALSSPLPELKVVEQREGVRTIAVKMERKISLWADLKALIKLCGVFRKERPWMVHSMTPKAGLLCMMAAWVTRVPKRVHTFTGLVWPTSTGLSRMILKTTDRILCACATHVIPEGQGVLDDLKNSHICRKPMKVLGYGNIMGVDMERFNPTRFAEVKKNEEVFRYIFVGRIVGDKGINELVEAFVRLNIEYPASQLTLVGKYEPNIDPIKPETLKQIEENPCIDACGPKYGEDLLVEYTKSDCFVMPSYREGFPNTVMEAGAMGLPAVVTDINGSREIIIHGKNGLIVPSQNADALYEAMKQMLIDNSARKRMAENARPLINSRFEKSFVQGCLIRFYEEVLK